MVSEKLPHEEQEAGLRTSEPKRGGTHDVGQVEVVQTEVFVNHRVDHERHLIHGRIALEGLQAELLYDLGLNFLCLQPFEVDPVLGHQLPVVLQSLHRIRVVFGVTQSPQRDQGTRTNLIIGCIHQLRDLSNAFQS